MRQPNAHEIVTAIAEDTDTPLDVVERLYEQTWAEYSDGARIRDYINVLVAKRVRENLRGRSGHRR